MSDAGRKGVTEQLSDKAKPDSQKTTTEKMGDTASGAYDRVAGAVQPEGQKSTTQKMSDSARGGSDDASNQGKSLYESATDTVSSAAKSVQDTLGGSGKKT